MIQDITVSPKVFDEIKALEAEGNVTIITGGIGGYKRPKVIMNYRRNMELLVYSFLLILQY